VFFRLCFNSFSAREANSSDVKPSSANVLVLLIDGCIGKQNDNKDARIKSESINNHQTTIKQPSNNHQTTINNHQPTKPPLPHTHTLHTR